LRLPRGARSDNSFFTYIVANDLGFFIHNIQKIDYARSEAVTLGKYESLYFGTAQASHHDKHGEEQQIIIEESNI
jgi:hypothetical protein